MAVGLLISAIFGGLVGAVFSAAGDNGVIHALLSYQAGGMLSFVLFLTVMARAPRAR